MKPIMRHLSANIDIFSHLLSSSQSNLVCLSCRVRFASRQRRLLQAPPTYRAFNTSRWLHEEKKSIEQSKQSSEPQIHTVPDDILPSHRSAQSWTLSKRFYKLMDDLMPKLAVASQRINNYTGTDYSGIAALRQEIKDQEQLVRARHDALQDSKSALDRAHTQSATSQKEVVALLERKQSWSAGDLERYMALIRSEHVNEHAVQTAKDAVAAAERALEEARARLERRERAQYHEEQIWSDTIRRNSTWVTFGLMGVNILILLGNLVVIEPWRRRRLVKELKGVVGEKDGRNETAEAVGAETGAAVVGVDTAAGPAVQLKEAEDVMVAAADPIVAPSTEPEVALEAGLEAAPAAAALALEDMEFDFPFGREYIRAYVRSLFSNQLITLRRIDITTVAIQSAAAGATLAIGAIYLFLVTG